MSCIVIQQFGKLVIFFKKILCFEREREREREKMVAAFLELPLGKTMHGIDTRIVEIRPKERKQRHQLSQYVFRVLLSLVTKVSWLCTRDIGSNIAFKKVGVVSLF